MVDPAGYAHARQDWFGGTVGVGKGTVLAQWSRIDQKFASAAVATGRADTFALAYTYPFSRRTTAYASLEYVRNSATSVIALNANDSQVAPGAAGADPRGVAVGVRHSF